MKLMKKGDFIELEYTGKVKDMDFVFDTTSEKEAKENNIHDAKASYDPVVICIGQGHVIKGLDEQLEGKELEREYKIELSPEQGFGKKNAKLIQLVATGKFIKQKINPIPGLQVNIDGMMGMIRTVSGGRTLVDFNHPLAGKELIYDFKINKIVKDDEEKLRALLKLQLNLKDIKVNIKEGNATIDLNIKQNLPKPIEEKLTEHIKELIPSIKKIEFKAIQFKAKEDKSKENKG
ncbi:peptidylprolyl isomerase [Candidatus Woesearchaeota archaeon CG06_land_8_20_14_3_00_33_13]|nr:MAG: peptidylprolyl isomerase [Candidatus Woesearchaeota archaeon CG10_big_fil_rev_8_21_14_0_10_33_12]PIU73051.1 MAG: peptidylprolyl isomerase [Candidatus Woesearchaeota archaeon CG06_land_8_20_14_3_00_33_13]